MWALVGLTTGLCMGLVFFSAYMKRDEIIANWSRYKQDPFYMFAAPMFKPSDDPRSRLQFAVDNFYDNVLVLLHKVFAVFLEPVFKVFKLFTDSLVQSLEGLFNIKAILGNSWNKFNQMTDIFMRRFQNVFHQFRVTFIKLHASIEKSFGVAVASIYSGLSTIYTMLSFMDLMVRIVLIALGIMMIMMIFLPFLLLPFIGLILSVIVVISNSPFSESIGGMAEVFCFAKGTRVEMSTGSKPIEEVKLGDRLRVGGTVKGCMRFLTSFCDMYTLHGVYVSGTHIVFQNDQPIHVRDHPDAKACHGSYEVYCLITSERKISVQSEIGVLVFADWEELSSQEDLLRWHKQVFESLNSCDYVPPVPDHLTSEAVFSGKVLVSTVYGNIPISDVHPGDLIYDGDGKLSRVAGCVQVDGSEVSKACFLGDGYISAGVWLLDSQHVWTNPTTQLRNNRESVWYSLFTDSGTFRIRMKDTDVVVRDFTDLGPDSLPDTYDWVLGSLRPKI